MRRYGFGEKTGETEKGGLPQFENGHVGVSEQASKFATQEYPKESPAGAVALALAHVGGVDLSEYVETEGPNLDFEAMHGALTAVDGIGEEKASEAMELIQETL